MNKHQLYNLLDRLEDIGYISTRPRQYGYGDYSFGFPGEIDQYFTDNQIGFSINFHTDPTFNIELCGYILDSEISFYSLLYDMTDIEVYQLLMFRLKAIHNEIKYALPELDLTEFVKLYNTDYLPLPLDIES